MLQLLQCLQFGACVNLQGPNPVNESVDSAGTIFDPAGRDNGLMQMRQILLLRLLLQSGAFLCLQGLDLAGWVFHPAGRVLDQFVAIVVSNIFGMVKVFTQPVKLLEILQSLEFCAPLELPMC